MRARLLAIFILFNWTVLIISCLPRSTTRSTTKLQLDRAASSSYLSARSPPLLRHSQQPFLMPYSCDAYHKSFKTEAWLSRHEANCAELLRQATRAFERAKAMSEAERRPKRRREDDEDGQSGSSKRVMEGSSSRTPGIGGGGNVVTNDTQVCFDNSILYFVH